MATSQYDPVEWTQGPVSLDGLQQMSNNDQYMFDNMPKMLYSSAGLFRSSGLKISSGRTAYGTKAATWIDITTYFGNFFSVGCNPVVVTTVHSWHGLRKFTTVRGLGNAESIDSRGFICQISSHENTTGPKADIITGGFLNWVAVGY